MNIRLRLIVPTLLAAGLLTSIPVAHAQRAQDGVRVSVSYDIQMPRPESMDEANEAMSKARKLMYERVNAECEEMLAQFASTCELSKLDINQHMKSARRSSKQGMIGIRADAKYLVELKSTDSTNNK